jgi:hypothetical protein
MIHGLWPLIAILIVTVIAITALKAFWEENKGGIEDYPYEKEQALFTPAERSFLGVLEQAVDGKSHNQSKRQDRDEFIDKALAAAKIPAFHFTAKQTYTIQELQNVLFSNKPEIINKK